MKVVASAGGRFNAFHLVRILEQRGVLQRFYTTSYQKTDEKSIPKNHVKNAPFFNLVGKGWKFFPAFVNKRLAWNVVKDNLFDIWVKGRIKDESPFDIFLGWANFSLHSMPAARSRGAKIIIDSSSSHIKQQSEILSEEYKFFGLNFNPVTKKNLDKMLAEYDETDFIIVPSSFAENSFVQRGISKNKILKVNYGVNLDIFSFKEQKSYKKKFRVICVGMLGVRKGIYYLIKAWERLKLPTNEVELLLVGAILPEFKAILKKINLFPNVRFENTSDAKKLAKMYQSSTVLIHPSIEDGFGMVVTEAMASGLPVVCTQNTGAKDLISENDNGFVINTKSVEELEEKILWFYKNREQALHMGERSLSLIKNQSWKSYGDNLLNKYKNVVLDY